ncbi:MAG: molybdenum cofactor cytidylyltransferase [Roseivirga sp.]|jgi:molybdenum cofactor cytidylyltransferase
MPKVNAILLAAGLSSRMNGPNKLLLPFHGGAVIQSVYRALSKSLISQITVVTGRDEEHVMSSLSLRLNDQFAHNTSFELGMTSSIQSGLNDAQPCDAIMICLGDMPWLQSADYDLLIDYFKAHGSSNKILVPWFDQKRANPVIFGKGYFEDILNHKDTNGCSQIVRDNQENVLNLNVDNDRFIKDIDSLDDIELID